MSERRKRWVDGREGVGKEMGGKAERRVPATRGSAFSSELYDNVSNEMNQFVSFSKL